MMDECVICDDTGWVCEAHPDRPAAMFSWVCEAHPDRPAAMFSVRPDACSCNAAMSCPVCNPSRPGIVPDMTRTWLGRSEH